MPRPRVRALLPLLAAIATLVGCTGSDSGPGPPPAQQLPDGAQLLRQSSQAMAQVSTARFTVGVQGTVGGFSLTGAQGQLARQGEAQSEAQGSATLAQGGQTAEIRFVITDGFLYLQGPTGGFQQLPAAAASTVYDPSAILDPQRGVPALLSSTRGARTEAREEVGGVDAFRVAAAFPADRVATLVPGATGDLNGQLWVEAEGSRLVQARFPVPGGIVTVNLSEFDAPVDIVPPPPG